MFTNDIDTGKQCLQGIQTQGNNVYKGYRHMKTMFTRDIDTGKQCLQGIQTQGNNTINVKNMHPHRDSNPGPWNTVMFTRDIDIGKQFLQGI